jgi:excisionase family DNA binding protein
MSPAAAQPLPKLLSVGEAATALALSKSMVRKLTRQGLPHIRIGKRLLFSEADLAAFVAGCRSGGGQLVDLAAARGVR